MQHERAAPVVWRKWHTFRQQARETAMSEEEFDTLEQDAYDLDTAGITGQDNPRTYERDDILGTPWWKSD